MVDHRQLSDAEHKALGCEWIKSFIGCAKINGEVAMKLAIVGISILISGTAMASEMLPLSDGYYRMANCEKGDSDFKGIRIFTSEGGYKSIAPQPDADIGQFIDGHCDVKSFKKNANIYSGVAKCYSGASGAEPSGSYKFKYKITDSSTFSIGQKTFHLCN